LPTGKRNTKKKSLPTSKLCCRDCNHFKSRTVEDDGYEHGYGTHKLEDGTTVQIGVCRESLSRGLRLVKTEDKKACERFEKDDFLTMPWER
jgi:hypothetical protein